MILSNRVQLYTEFHQLLDKRNKNETLRGVPYRYQMIHHRVQNHSCNKLTCYNLVQKKTWNVRIAFKLAILSRTIQSMKPKLFFFVNWIFLRTPFSLMNPTLFSTLLWRNMRFLSKTLLLQWQKDLELPAKGRIVRVMNTKKILPLFCRDSSVLCHWD